MLAFLVSGHEKVKLKALGRKNVIQRLGPLPERTRLLYGSLSPWCNSSPGACFRRTGRLRPHSS